MGFTHYRQIIDAVQDFEIRIAINKAGFHCTSWNLSAPSSRSRTTKLYCLTYTSTVLTDAWAFCTHASFPNKTIVRYSDRWRQSDAWAQSWHHRHWTDFRAQIQTSLVDVGFTRLWRQLSKSVNRATHAVHINYIEHNGCPDTILIVVCLFVCLFWTVQLRF